MNSNASRGRVAALSNLSETALVVGGAISSEDSSRKSLAGVSVEDAGTSLPNPKIGPCGKFEWIVKFAVSGLPKNGFLIQHMIHTYRSYDCKTGAPKKTQDWDFLEVFCLIDGETPSYTLVGNPNHDNQDKKESAANFATGFDDWFVPEDPDTYGAWSKIGSLYYSEKCPAYFLGSKISKPSSPTAHPGSDALPSFDFNNARGDVITPAEMKSLGATLLTRRAFEEWNCCTSTDWYFGETSSYDLGGTNLDIVWDHNGRREEVHDQHPSEQGLDLGTERAQNLGNKVGPAGGLERMVNEAKEHTKFPDKLK